MQIVKNTLELGWDQWDDPGDYPSGAGAGPLPSVRYPIVEGEVVVFLTKGEFMEDLTASELAERLGDALELPSLVQSIETWDFDPFMVPKGPGKTTSYSMQTYKEVAGGYHVRLCVEKVGDVEDNTPDEYNGPDPLEEF